MAYVLVQHLDPRHESMLPELLARASPLPVSEIREDTEVEPDHVYVSPGQRDVTIEANTLRLVPRETTGGQHLPIDAFLRTLAAAQGPRAIGVILSGTASDGTLGVKAVKAEGGITFAQEPRSAAYEGMPRSAIASGAIDFVMTPDRIAREVARLARHPYVATALHEEGGGASPPPPTEEPDGLETILGLLRKATGVDFAAYKPPTIRRRLARRMALTHIETLDEYARHLEGHPEEVQALYQDCLIHVTSFFRDPGAFEALCETVVPPLIGERSAGAPIRIWVPGCATGEEAYSIVICLLERAGELRANPTFQLFATDIAESGLEKARAGTYPANIAQDVSPERLRRFFTEVDGHYQVGKAIREMCVFARHDLARDPPFSRMDIISCRNLLIYLEPRLQRRVLATFHYALQPSGFLLLGSSESGGAAQDLFTPVDQKHRIYSKRPAATGVLGFARYFPGGGDGREMVAPAPAPAKEDTPREAERLLLAHAPASVILDDKDNVVEFRGQTDPYLGHATGRATLNIFKIARKGLVLDLHQVILEARKKDAPARRDGIAVRQGRQVRWLDLEAIPLRSTPPKARSLLLTFSPKPETTPRDTETTRSNFDGDDARQSADLRRQLAEATQYIQAITQEHDAASEELQAANEEVLSANEELQSINEELETAKEELQSSNEELTTLNHELNERNEQVGRALDYANGIVETVHNPLVILDGDMRVTRANSAFYAYFQVSPRETVGRRIYDLGEGHWDIVALRRALEEILPRDARLLDFEVEEEFPRIGRRTLALNAQRVRQGGDGESILLAMEDRTESHKLAHEREELLGAEQQARKKAENTDRIKDEFVATLSHELRGPLNAMVGWVTVLRAEEVDGAIRKRGMDAIERGIRTQSRLIDELLDYSRMVTGKLRLSSRLVDLAPVVDAAVGAVRSAAEAKGIRIDVVAEATATMIHGDPDRLQQVFWNLLSNAVKFTPSGGRVEVWIGREGTHMQVRVRDTGQGIAGDFLPHVFERFRQEEGSIRRKHGGLGLGMAIVEELVELHGGAVHADSPGEGRGSTFTVVLPIPPLLVEPRDGVAEAPEPTTPPVAMDRSALEGVHILVVEDEADGRDLLVTVFEGCGARVTAVGSAAEAMGSLQAAAPDVIVSDIGMPKEDGHALMRRIRALEGEGGNRVPAIALTAFAGGEDRLKAREAGYDLHVAKPADPVDVVAKVALLAKRRRAAGARDH